MNVHSVRLWRVLPGLVIVASLLLSSAAMASVPVERPTPPQAGLIDAASPLENDDATWDVGAEAQGDAPPAGAGGNDLPYANGAAWNFYTQMRNVGYTGSHDFFYTNQNSWETDFKRAALGGNENNMVDNVDIAYYHDHGNGGVGEWFPWGHTDNWLEPNDCLASYGDKDLEWLAIGGCSTFSDALLTGWASCLNGAHLLLGYKTTAYDGNWGGIWADQMLGWQALGIWFRAPKTVTQAWFTQCDQTQPSGVTARVIAEDSTQFNDYVWGRGPVYNAPVNWPKYKWDHNCYKAPPMQIDAGTLGVLAAVPSFQVLPRNVTRDYAQGIANALGLQGSLALSPDGTQFALNDTSGTMTGTLSVDTASGGYQYQNLGQLWVPPTGPLNLPTTDAAIALGHAFLSDNALTLPGIQNANQAAPHVETEGLQEFGSTTQGAARNQPEAPLQFSSADVMVAYSRTLSVPASTMSGASVLLEVSVSGPGSTTKLYYGGQSNSSRLSSPMAQSPIGLAGGSRDVEPGSTSVAVKTADATWTGFLSDTQKAIVTVPINADEILRKSETFTYYEQPHNVPQKELIPAWAYVADFKKDGAVILADALVYVPASADYYPPAVTIDSPAPGATIVAGRPISLTSTADGGFGPLTYEWSSDQQGVLGHQEDMSVRLLPATQHPGGTGATPVLLSVKVTNGNGQSRTVSVNVNVTGSVVWLPMVLK